MAAVRRKAGFPYKHFGIYLGDGSVIHFAGEPGAYRERKAGIQRTAVAGFARGSKRLWLEPEERASSSRPVRVVERALEVELTDHLGYERHQEPPGGTGNTRNGSTRKTLVTEHGLVEIQSPRDREGSFEPQLVRKRQRRFEGFDEKVLALYARGMSTRDIEAHLHELYGVSVGRDVISRVTDAVMDDARVADPPFG